MTIDKRHWDAADEMIRKAGARGIERHGHFNSDTAFWKVFGEYQAKYDRAMASGIVEGRGAVPDVLTSIACICRTRLAELLAAKDTPISGMAYGRDPRAYLREWATALVSVLPPDVDINLDDLRKPSELTLRLTGSEHMHLFETVGPGGLAYERICHSGGKRNIDRENHMSNSETFAGFTERVYAEVLADFERERRYGAADFAARRDAVRQAADSVADFATLRAELAKYFFKRAMTYDDGPTFTLSFSGHPANRDYVVALELRSGANFRIRTPRPTIWFDFPLTISGMITARDKIASWESKLTPEEQKNVDAYPAIEKDFATLRDEMRRYFKQATIDINGDAAFILQFPGDTRVYLVNNEGSHAHVIAWKTESRLYPLTISGMIALRDWIAARESKPPKPADEPKAGNRPHYIGREYERIGSFTMPVSMSQDPTDYAMATYGLRMPIITVSRGLGKERDAYGFATHLMYDVYSAIAQKMATPETTAADEPKDDTDRWERLYARLKTEFPNAHFNPLHDDGFVFSAPMATRWVSVYVCRESNGNVDFDTANAGPSKRAYTPTTPVETLIADIRERLAVEAGR